MLTSLVRRALTDKLTLIREPGSPDLALVGPVRLPVKLDDQEITFQWYTWLNLESTMMQQEDLLDMLPQANLASYQQSSVLVYGDFAGADTALVRMHSICHTGTSSEVKDAIAAISRGTR
ncbi:hypothetical protein LJK88_50530 [Paenibacillus sp. P26]|nr:hypothetical protein LJK88_50530 [Paenibacillus sp. P26]